MTEPALDPGQDCQVRDCDYRAQRLVEIELAGGDTDELALCSICAFVVISRDVGGKVRVIGP